MLCPTMKWSWPNMLFYFVFFFFLSLSLPLSFYLTPTLFLYFLSFDIYIKSAKSLYFSIWAALVTLNETSAGGQMMMDKWVAPSLSPLLSLPSPLSPFPFHSKVTFSLPPTLLSNFTDWNFFLCDIGISIHENFLGVPIILFSSSVFSS